jgi:hypothetical protein
MLGASSITLSNAPKGQGYLAHPTFFIDREGELHPTRRQPPALITPAQANDRFEPPVTVGNTALAWPAKNAARAPSKRARAPNRAPRDTDPPVVLRVLWLWRPFLCTAVGTARPELWPDREGYSAPWPEHQQPYPLQRAVERGLPRAPHEQLSRRHLGALQDPGRPRRSELARLHGLRRPRPIPLPNSKVACYCSASTVVDGFLMASLTLPVVFARSAYR